MIYPEFLKKGDQLAVTACSDGRTDPADIRRMENGMKKLQERGFSVVATPNTWKSTEGRSASAKERAEQWMEVVRNSEVKAVFQACGGDYLCEMLSYVDYDEVAKYPKWHQGFSDPTGLLYGITTNCDIATVYGGNFGNFGMEPWHESLEKNLDILTGKAYQNSISRQVSYDMYEATYEDKVTGLETYRLTHPVYWSTREPNGCTGFTGRQLGGCLDVLVNLVGTRHDGTQRFIQKYGQEGIVWFFESFAVSSAGLTRTLWQLREAGWFAHAKGFVFGRPAFFTEEYGLDYESSAMAVLEDLKVPVIFGADFGHRPPQMTLVLGAKASWSCHQGKGEVMQWFQQ